MGAVLSILMVTDWEFVPPALVAMQVRTVPFVSAVSEVEEQPVLEEIADSASVTVQLTLTLLLNQLLLPRVPVIFGAITGGVVSVVAGISPTKVLACEA